MLELTSMLVFVPYGDDRYVYRQQYLVFALKRAHHANSYQHKYALFHASAYLACFDLLRIIQS